ncbi:group II intron reverse transcriptase/maturase [Candidatus Uabimicrobium sp. HlEnr_7]|uniref:group II intron reverse transcriptase/maturase n=1 Tax=Candidatus Uabimicrobium helgolandensis TaxID=3095367 RepID=UPI00355620F2
MNPSRYEWKALPWKKFERIVFKLQKRIYQASRRGNVSAVHKLQRLLMKSWSAKCLAVRRVTQDNRGKKTAGVDGVKSLTAKQRIQLVTKMDLKQKAHPVRRVWIPKYGKQEKRPLGIPTMDNRALQMLAKLALEPEWEAKFEANSYGFRPGRSAHDAREAIFNSIHQKPHYILDADLEKCFDRINHTALLSKLNTYPVLRRTIKRWLKAGIMEGKSLYPSKEGAPQGGVCSPLLAGIALHGLETAIINAFPTQISLNGKLVRWRPKIVVYADDFVLMHTDLTALKKAKEITSEWLKEMGLTFKAEKTRITHTLSEYNDNIGFDFLGFNVRQYKSKRQRGFKTLIKPSKEAISRHLRKIRDIFRKNKHASQEDLIRRLNPLIRGWANYHSTGVSSEIFSKLDNLMWEKLSGWAKRKHPKTGWRKTINKYFRDGWRFKTREGVSLLKYSSIPIRRHVKVQGCRSPFDGDFIYWAIRMGKSRILPPRKARLLKEQKGKCTWCGLHFKHGDILEIDHIVPLNHGGKSVLYNLQLLHGHCHDTKTAIALDCRRGTDDKS